MIVALMASISAYSVSCKKKGGGSATGPSGGGGGGGGSSCPSSAVPYLTIRLVGTYDLNDLANLKLSSKHEDVGGSGDVMDLGNFGAGTEQSFLENQDGYESTSEDERFSVQLSSESGDIIIKIYPDLANHSSELSDLQLSNVTYIKMGAASDSDLYDLEDPEGGLTITETTNAACPQGYPTGTLTLN